MGQLGDGTTTNRNTHGAISDLENCSAIAAGYDFSIILDNASDAWTVGNGLGGQLGNMNSAVSTTPSRVLMNVQEVAAGESHALFLMLPDDDGSQAVMATGANFDGQLGDGSSVRKTTPVVIAASTEYKTIAAGGDSSCFSSGVDLELQCAGSNRDGQIGLFDNQTVTTPTTVPGATGSVSKMSLGDTHSLLLHDDEDRAIIYSMGNNVYGELGDGTKTPRRMPIEVEAIDIVPPPTPSPTPAPTPPPTPAPSPEPTPTPEAPTPSPEPTPTQAPTPTEAPSPSPEPTPTQAPTPTPSPTRDPSGGEISWPLIAGGGA